MVVGAGPKPASQELPHPTRFQHVVPPTRLRLEFPRESSLILRFAGKVGNPCRQSRGIDPPVMCVRVCVCVCACARAFCRDLNEAPEG